MHFIWISEAKENELSNNSQLIQYLFKKKKNNTNFCMYCKCLQIKAIII